MMAQFYRYAAIVMLVFASGSIAGSAHARIDSAQVYLRGVSPDAMVEVNGVRIELDPSKPLVLAPGSMQIGVSDGETSVVKSFFMRGGDYRVLNFNHNPDYATIDVITEPGGAELYLEGERKGTTPYLDSLVMPGTFMLTVGKYGYDRVEKRVNLLPQEELELTIDLKHSRTWLDSVAHAAKMRRQQRRFMQRMVTSAFGAVFAGAALYFNWDAAKKIDHAESMSAAYDGAGEGFTEIREQYYLDRERAAESIRRRDVLGGLAAAMALGFSLSFVF